MKKILTLCMVYNNSHILLGMKKKGFGEGRWNGFGGKVDKGEHPEEAALRELREEAGIVAHDMRKRGILSFEFAHDPEILEVHLFSASQFSGTPQETDEMRPHWFLHNAIPYDEMWPDDRHWLPLVLRGRNLNGNFYFKDHHTLLRYHIQEH